MLDRDISTWVVQEFKAFWWWVWLSSAAGLGLGVRVRVRVRVRVSCGAVVQGTAPMRTDYTLVLLDSSPGGFPASAHLIHVLTHLSSCCIKYRPLERLNLQRVRLTGLLVLFSMIILNCPSGTNKDFFFFLTEFKSSPLLLYVLHLFNLWYDVWTVHSDLLNHRVCRAAAAAYEKMKYRLLAAFICNENI